MALHAKVCMLSGSLLRTLELPAAATVGDTRLALRESGEGTAEQQELLEAMLSAGADFVVGTEILEDDAALQDRADDEGTVTINLVLKPSPLAGKTFKGRAQIKASGVYGSAFGSITFNEDDSCDVNWGNGYTSAGHADSASEGEFEAEVQVRLPKVSIQRKGKGRRRSGSCYGGFEEDAWRDDGKDYKLDGVYAPELGLKLQGWTQMSYWNNPMDDCFLTEQEA